jgi:hypothetical protein
MQIEPRVMVHGRSGRGGSTSAGARVGACARSFTRECFLSILLGVSLSACASVSFERLSATSGTFKSTGWSVTILEMDFPKGALMVARENASDANLANMVVDDVTQIPSWWPLNWLFEIFSIRYASVSGTWGFTGQENQSAGAKP